MKMDWLDPIKEDLKDVSGGFVFYESGESFDFDMGGLYYGYKETPSDKDVADILGSDYTEQDFVEKWLAKYYPEEYEAFKANENDYYSVVEFLTNWADWEEEIADNTYNWSYLGPMTVDFRVLEDPEGTKWFVWKNHRGGDVRGNYGDYNFVEVVDFPDVVSRFSGSGTWYFNFKDGSQFYIDSQQDNDVWYLDADEIEYNGSNNLAEKWANLIQENASDWDGTEEIFEYILELVK